MKRMFWRTNERKKKKSSPQEDMGNQGTSLRYEYNQNRSSSNWGVTVPYPGGLTGQKSPVESLNGPVCRISSSDTRPTPSPCENVLQDYWVWVNHDAQASNGNVDIRQEPFTNVCELATACQNTPGCTAFNTSGFLKSKADIRTPQGGSTLYVRKQGRFGFEPFLN